MHLFHPSTINCFGANIAKTIEFAMDVPTHTAEVLPAAQVGTQMYLLDNLD